MHLIRHCWSERGIALTGSHGRLSAQRSSYLFLNCFPLFMCTTLLYIYLTVIFAFNSLYADIWPIIIFIEVVRVFIWSIKPLRKHGILTAIIINARAAFPRQFLTSILTVVTVVAASAVLWWDRIGVIDSPLECQASLSIISWEAYKYFGRTGYPPSDHEPSRQWWLHRRQVCPSLGGHWFRWVFFCY